MIQLIVILAYFALTLYIGIVRSKRADTTKKFFGTQMGVVAIVCASAGEWLGGTSTTGVSEYGFVYGISGAWYTIANGLGILFLAFCFAKLYRSIGSMTVPGIIRSVFGPSAQIVSSILLVLVMLAVGVSQIIAAGKFGQALMGIDFRVSAIVFTAIFVVYTLAGGMNAVSTTNAMHLFVMYLGIIVSTVMLLTQLGGFSGLTEGVSQIEASDGGNYFSMTAIGFPKVSSWIVASLLGACTAQAGIQPVLAAKDEQTAQRACIWTAVVTVPFGLLTALIGIMAKIMAHQGILLDAGGHVLTDGKLALTSVMLSLPPLVGGLVLAAGMAAILSTVSPIILAAGTMLARDIYQTKIKPNAGDRQVLMVSRIMTATAGLICCVGAIFLAEKNNILDLVYSAYSLRGALFIVLILGFTWKKANAKAACMSMVLTGIVAVFWSGIKVMTGTYPVAPWFTETYAAILTAFISMVIFSVMRPLDHASDEAKV